ncbi:hypothetical protein PR202_ga20678 [Eleusine coracana subsp. coracana]|uniref:Protein RFT1 homolog n=1 Tax=Eleusine coracana subsp. coracana TaxID=191504 RepID=A0AAV5CZ28_ELECO|nr:hypothetical protein PR202_ga20678 [Eleusine coracana subsp. coracana]
MAADGGPPRSRGGATASRRSREGHFRYLVALQLLTKLVSFVFNSWCMGAVEGITHSDSNSRLSGQFVCSEVTDDNTRLLKVARMAFPIGIVATTAGCIHELWKQKMKLSDPSAASVYGFEDPYVQAILINGIACILELLAEPLYILSQNLFLLKLRLISEVVATLVRCITAYILIKNSSLEMAFSFFKDWMDYDRRLWRACKMLTGQSMKELVFQKGQELIPFRSSYLDEYGIVDRLGSLVVRLIFHPFEESNRLKFAEMASGTLEAFLQSIASEPQLKMLNDFSLFSSVIMGRYATKDFALSGIYKEVFPGFLCNLHSTSVTIGLVGFGMFWSYNYNI